MNQHSSEENTLSGEYPVEFRSSLLDSFVDGTGNDPEQMLAAAYDTASKYGLTEKNVKFLNQYHKCLYALIKVLTKRMKLFYQGKFRQAREYNETEEQFQHVLGKII